MTDAVAEFRAALRSGRGRAGILLQADPSSSALRFALLDACTRNLTYDRQCEDSRADYLARLIDLTGEPSTFWPPLLASLVSEPPADVAVDRGQIFEVLCRLASADDRLDRSPLRNFLATADLELIRLSNSLESLIRLDGIEPLVLCARRFPSELAEEPWLMRSMRDALAARDGAEQADLALRSARADHPELANLIALADRADAVSEPAAIADYATYKRRIDEPNAFPWYWLRQASREELGAAALDLAAETDASRLLKLLRIFMRHDFPGPVAVLVRLAEHPTPRVASAATWAASRIQSRDIRALALRLMRDATRSTEGVRLLRNNCEAGDSALVERALARAVDDPVTTHGIGLSLLSVLDGVDRKVGNQIALNESRDALLHLYEHGPCSLCRGSLVTKLTELGAVPEWMARECQYDCDRDTANLFSREK